MLKNKIALITGAGRGIGRAIAIALAKEGAEVVINYNGSEERAKEVKQTIEENGGKASMYKCNVSDFAACEAMIKDIIKEYGHLDILVNNAGITKDGLIMKMFGLSLHHAHTQFLLFPESSEMWARQIMLHPKQV